ncbi:MAG: phospholipase D-like domain-containing protein, partial [Planctomycetota bacterium]
VLDAADKGEWNPKTTAALQGIGITVWTTGATMHQKFAIIDGKTVINGSGNWSTGAFSRYTDDWIVFRGQKEVADAFQDEFDLLLEEGKKVKRIKLPDKEKEDEE